MSARILVVDDSGFSRRVVRQILENAGYQIEEAADGFRALELYPSIRPDVVLMDVVMDPISGLELLPLILELDPKAKVIAATADIQEQTAEALKKAGALGLLNKPFKKDELLANVSMVLEANGDPCN